MPRVTRSRTIAAGPEEIWRVVSDPHHLPRWWPSLRRVEEVSSTTWTKVLATPKGRSVRADFTRTEATPLRRFAWRQEIDESPFERILREATTEISLEPATDRSTRVELRVTERLRGLSRLGGFMVRRATGRRLDEALDGLERAAAGREERRR